MIPQSEILARKLFAWEWPNVDWDSLPMEQINKQMMLARAGAILDMISTNDNQVKEQEKELKEYRDLFFNCESGFRHGYMDGVSDMMIQANGKTPYGENKRWEIFSSGLKSWDPEKIKSETNSTESQS